MTSKKKYLNIGISETGYHFLDAQHNSIIRQLDTVSTLPSHLAKEAYTGFLYFLMYHSIFELDLLEKIGFPDLSHRGNHVCYLNEAKALMELGEFSLEKTKTLREIIFSHFNGPDQQIRYFMEEELGGEISNELELVFPGSGFKLHNGKISLQGMGLESNIENVISQFLRYSLLHHKYFSIDTLINSYFSWRNVMERKKSVTNV